VIVKRRKEREDEESRELFEIKNACVSRCNDATRLIIQIESST